MKVLRFALLLVLATISAFCVSSLYTLHQGKNYNRISQMASLPPLFVKTASFEFTGMTADFLMLNVLTFMGEKTLREKKTTAEEWKMLLAAFRLLVFLEPRATDPFILATTTLPYESGLVSETNELLLKVAKVRTDDYRPYFFLWYNYYQMLHDPEKGAQYLKKAAAIPGAPKYLAPLVTRMHLYSGRIEASIIYIQELLAGELSQDMREYLLTRLKSLKAIIYLESKVEQYTKTYQRRPKSLNDLLESGLIKEIPQDPYGGTFYLNKAGRVYSTSKLVKKK